MSKLFEILFKKRVDVEFEKTRKEYRAISKKVKEFKHQLKHELESDSNLSNTVEPTNNEIVFVKNEWVRLPDAIGNGVLSMGIEESEKRKSFLVHYEPHSELFTHKHPYNIERIQILTGYIKDNVNDKLIDEGESYVIDKNINHNIVTLDKEAYLYIVFSEMIDTLTVKNLIV